MIGRMPLWIVTKCLMDADADADAVDCRAGDCDVADGVVTINGSCCSSLLLVE